ncbi:MAG: SEC-C metal-binding domain-containing protein [Acidobacteriota bacterium]
MIDITPPIENEKRLLFLPSDKLQFEGFIVPTICKDLAHSAFSQAFIAAKHFIDLLRSYDAAQHASLTQSLIGERQIGRNRPCPCGSGKKFKRCHGR